MNKPTHEVGCLLTAKRSLTPDALAQLITEALQRFNDREIVQWNTIRAEKFAHLPSDEFCFSILADVPCNEECNHAT